MTQTIQQYFVQVTVIKGRLLNNEDGSIEKVIDETIKDDLYPFDNEAFTTDLAQKLLNNGNLDFEEVQANQ